MLMLTHGGALWMPVTVKGSVGQSVRLRASWAESAELSKGAPQTREHGCRQLVPPHVLRILDPRTHRSEQHQPDC